MKDLFCIRRLIPAAIFYGIGGVLGLCTVVMLLFANGFPQLVSDVCAGGVVETSAVITWVVIQAGLMIVTCMSACAMAVGLFWEQRSKGDGFDILYYTANVQIWFSRITGGMTLIYLIVRVIRYLLVCDWMETGVYEAYVMIIPEAAMVVQAVGLYCLLHRFLNALCDSFASMAYIRLSGKLDDQPTSGLCGGGFWLLAFVCLLLMLSRGNTFLQSQALNPMAILSAGMYGCVAVANALMGMYLLRYRKIASQMRFQMARNT